MIRSASAIGAGTQFLLEHSDFALGFALRGGFVVLAVVNGRIRMTGDDNLGNVELRLGHVELRTIFLVEVCDVLIGRSHYAEPRPTSAACFGAEPNEL